MGHATAATTHAAAHTHAAAALTGTSAARRVGADAGRGALLTDGRESRPQIGLDITPAFRSGERRRGRRHVSSGRLGRAGLRIRGTAPVWLRFTHD
jgi:hypothetical protein